MCVISSNMYKIFCLCSPHAYSYTLCFIKVTCSEHLVVIRLCYIYYLQNCHYCQTEDMYKEILNPSSLFYNICWFFILVDLKFLILSNIIFLRLVLCINIIWHHQREFDLTDQIFCICQILEKTGSTIRQCIHRLQDVLQFS
jgi:cobalamin synthase